MAIMKQQEVTVAVNRMYEEQRNKNEGLLRTYSVGLLPGLEKLHDFAVIVIENFPKSIIVFEKFSANF